MKHTTLKIPFSESEQAAIRRLAKRFRYHDIEECIREVVLTEAATVEIAESAGPRSPEDLAASPLWDDLRKDEPR